MGATSSSSIPLRDLDEIVAVSGRDMAKFSGKRILVTGATGFVGTWFIASLHHAKIDVEVIGLDHFEYDYLASSGWGSIRCDLIVHMAPVGVVPVLDLAKRCGNVPVLFISSGVVYGTGDQRHDKYRSMKYDSEALCREYGNAVIARLFTFIGPGIQQGRGYAAGDFIADAKAGRPICVGGNPHSVRSWMYPTDMVSGLWSIISRGEPGSAHDVGSGFKCSIADFAIAIAAQMKCDVVFKYNAAPYTSYTPFFTGNIEIGTTVGLQEAIERTLASWQ